MPSHLPRAVAVRAPLLASLLALSACGGGGGTDTVSPPPPRTNHPPAAANACVAVPSASASITDSLPASDPDGDALVYQITAQPVNGQLNAEPGGRYTYTPTARGMDRFSYRAIDPAGLVSNEATVYLLVDGVVRIMPLGDSITEGVTVGQPDPGQPPLEQRVGYRARLYNALESLSSSYGIGFVGSQRAGAAVMADADHEGHGGWCDDAPCTANPKGDTISANVEQFLRNNPPDIVLLHIGTNNFDPDPTGVQTILDRISNWAATNNPVSVFVARIIPALDGRPVTVFNDNVVGIAYDRPRTRVRMVDQQSVLQVPGDPDWADATLMADNVHPNQTGYDRMAERWRLDLVASGVLPTCE